VKATKVRYYIKYRKAMYEGWWVYMNLQTPGDNDIPVAQKSVLTRWGGWLWAKNYIRMERKIARVEARRRYV
jgi:hypothetical protein